MNDEPTYDCSNSKASPELPVSWGLRGAEKRLFQRVFKPQDTLLEVDCGEGRIALSLWEVGYQKTLGVDASRAKIVAARRHNRIREYGVCFRTAPSTALNFDSALFEGVIWDAERLPKMPDTVQLRNTFTEIYRVATPGAWFIFTTPLALSNETLAPQAPDNVLTDTMETLRCEAQEVGFHTEVDILSSFLDRKVDREYRFWVFQKPEKPSDKKM